MMYSNRYSGWLPPVAHAVIRSFVAHHIDLAIKAGVKRTSTQAFGRFPGPPASTTTPPKIEASKVETRESAHAIECDRSLIFTFTDTGYCVVQMDQLLSIWTPGNLIMTVLIRSGFIFTEIPHADVPHLAGLQFSSEIKYLLYTGGVKFTISTAREILSTVLDKWRALEQSGFDL
jgi:hypothetical protein